MNVWHYIQAHYLDNVVAGFIYTFIAGSVAYLWKGRALLAQHRHHQQLVRDIHTQLMNKEGE